MKKLSLSCLAVVLGAVVAPAASAEVLTLAIESPADAAYAYEHFSPRKNTVGRTRVGKKSLRLSRASRSVVAFQLPVLVGIVPDTVLHSRLTLPLVRPTKRPRLLDLTLVGLDPNLGPFQPERGYISRQTELTPAESSQVFVEAGSTEIVVRDVLLSAVNASLQHPNWEVGGYGNTLAFKLWRSDSGKRTPRIAGLARLPSGTVPTLELCRDESCILKVACLGDSNTHSDWMSALGIISWCELLNGRHFAPTIETHNYAVSGGTLASSKMEDANEQLNTVIEGGNLPNVVVAAFGSNDILFFGAIPEELVAAYLDLRLRVEQIDSRLLVALTPIVYGDFAVHNATIASLNALITATFPAEEIVDFFIADHDCFADNVHMNNLGQELRCDAALDALF